MAARLTVDDALHRLTRNYAALCLPHHVPVLDAPPTALEFMREYVAMNSPVVIRGAFSHWPALTKWTDEYLCERLGDKEISVEVTPNGRADAVTQLEGQAEPLFMLPDTQRMRFSDFLEKSKRPEGPVYYISHQNNSLREEDEFGALLIEDIEHEIGFAAEAFGCPPEAVNFWMGDSRAVTSTHKDHYENTYCVIRGEKTFLLFPPTCLPWMAERDFPVGQYRQNDKGDFDVELLGCTRPWIPIDPLSPSPSDLSLFSRATPLTVTVRAGELLYLPSLWLHHVRQGPPGCQCIAVNMWHDMRFGPCYVHHALVADLIGRPVLDPDALDDDD